MICPLFLDREAEAFAGAKTGDGAWTHGGRGRTRLCGSTPGWKEAARPRTGVGKVLLCLLRTGATDLWNTDNPPGDRGTGTEQMWLYGSANGFCWRAGGGWGP